jgi:predicted dehydrogenase
VSKSSHASRDAEAASATDLAPEPQNPLRVALVGCGPRGTGHARAYGRVPSLSLVACCDVDQGRLDAFADQFQIPLRFTDLQEMLDHVRPHLVDIVTPPEVRRPLIEMSLPFRPKAILVEKPLGLRPEEGYQILDACRDAGVPLFVNHQLHFFEPLRRFRDLLREGVIGEVRFLRATTRWSLLEHGTHLFDLVDFLFEDELGFREILAQTVGAETDPSLPDSPFYTSGIIACDRDVHVYFECGPRAPQWPGSPSPWHQFGVEIVGTRGVAGCSLNRGWWCRSDTVQEDETYVHDEHDDNAEVRLLESLVEALPDPTGHPNHADRSALSFDLVMAAQRASLWRSWVDISKRVSDVEIDLLRTMQHGAPTAI